MTDEIHEGGEPGGEDVNARHAEKMAKKKAARDRMLAGKTIEKGLLIVHTGKGKGKSTAAFGMVLLDELNIVLRYGYLPLDEVIAYLRAKPADTHVIVTGRNAADELIEAADLVTEMTMVKHPFREGVKAQAGIEF